MKKKTYLAPATIITDVNLQPLMNPASITSIGGNSGIQKGTGDTPTEADSRRRRRRTDWEDEEEWDEEEEW